MKKMIVSLKKHSYPVVIGTNLFEDISSFFPLKSGDQAMLVTNSTLASFYIERVCYILNKMKINLDITILPDGEKYKNLTTLNVIFTMLLQKAHNRDTTLIALGGGVIGDLTGFAAASYQRGVRFIQIPTTLLSQVDSSIGGKTAVNHKLGKNMIGAFWHPSLVVTDLNFLKTLPSRELISGLAEVIKYAIAFDNIFFDWLEKNLNALLRMDEEAMMYCIQRCCELKINVVTIDNRERELRTLLNFGHTFGHAIETETKYSNWLHGEAVSVGMVMAVRISEYLGQFKKEDTQRIIELLQRAKLPIKTPKEISLDSYLSYIKRDKKVLAKKTRLVLPIAIGKSEIRSDVPYEIVVSAIEDCK